MARRYLDQILDEPDLASYPSYYRWYASQHPFRYTLPEIHQDFRNPVRMMNRFDRCSALDYYWHHFWVTQGFQFPNFESFCSCKRNDKRRYHHFNKDKRNNREKRYFSSRQEEFGGYRADRGRTTDFLTHYERRYPSNWNREEVSQHCPHSQDRRNLSHLSFRSSSLDLCSEDIFNDQRLHNFKQVFESRNPSSVCLAPNENMTQNDYNFKENGLLVDSSVDANGIAPSEFDLKGNCKSPSGYAQYDGQSNVKKSYESWYCPEEQQQIVDMLKEVDLRHERQLKRDILLSRGDQPSCSDESTSSHNDSRNSKSGHQKSSSSSDEDDDDIHIILYRDTLPSVPESPTEDLPSGYPEETASEFFEEFQNIFSGSPEKKIINSLTKENMKIQTNTSQDTESRGTPITDSDKNAVKTVLNFDVAEDVSEKEFEADSRIVSSSPKETFIKIPTTEGLTSSPKCTKASCQIGVDAFNDTTLNPVNSTQTAESESATKNNSKGTSNLKQQLNSANSSYSKENHLCANLSSSPSNQLKHESYSESQYSDESTKMSFPKYYFKKRIAPRSKKNFTKEKNTYDNFKQSGAKFVDPENFKANIAEREKTKANGHFTETPLSSYNCLRSNEFVRSEVKPSTKSEPLLAPDTKSAVYRRISVTEIFSTVSLKPGNNFVKFPGSGSRLINISNLSPSEHLKQILGIGQNTGSVKSSSSDSCCHNRAKNCSSSLDSSNTKACSLKTMTTVDNVDSQKGKSSVSPKYPCCMGSNSETSIKGDTMNESLAHSKTQPDSTGFLTSDSPRGTSKGFSNKNCTNKPHSMKKNDQNEGQARLSDANCKTKRGNNFPNSSNQTNYSKPHKGNLVSREDLTPRKNTSQSQETKSGNRRENFNQKPCVGGSFRKPLNSQQESETSSTVQERHCNNTLIKDELSSSFSKYADDNKYLNEKKKHPKIDSHTQAKGEKLQEGVHKPTNKECLKTKKYKKKNKEKKLDEGMKSKSTPCDEHKNKMSETGKSSDVSKASNSSSYTRNVLPDKQGNPNSEYENSETALNTGKNYHLEKVESDGRNPQVKLMNSVEENKSSANVLSVKNVECHEKSETSKMKRNKSPADKCSRVTDEHSKKYYSYDKNNQFRDGSKYWRGNNRNNYFYTSRENRNFRNCSWNPKRSNYFRNDIRPSRYDTLKAEAGNQNDCNQFNNENNAQPTANGCWNAGGFSCKSPEKEGASYDVGISSKVGNSFSGEKLANNLNGSPRMKTKVLSDEQYLNSTVVSLLNSRILDYFPDNSLSQILLLKIRHKTEQMLEEAENLVSLLEKRKSIISLIRNELVEYSLSTRKESKLHSSDISKNVSDCVNDRTNTNGPGGRRLEEIKMKDNLDHVLTCVPEKLIIPLLQSVIDNCLNSKQALKVNFSKHAHTHMQIQNIFPQFYSAKSSEDLEERLQFCLNSIKNKRMLQVLPLFLKFLSVLSVINSTWTRKDLVELLELIFNGQNRNGSRFSNSRNKMRDHMNSILKCWNVLLSCFLKLRSI